MKNLVFSSEHYFVVCPLTSGVKLDLCLPNSTTFAILLSQCTLYTWGWWRERSVSYCYRTATIRDELELSSGKRFSHLLSS